jgi:hypothetical protein
LARRGRKRRALVKREKNGKPQRAATRQMIRQQEDEVREVAIVARCKAMGWLPRKVNGADSWKPTEDMRAVARQPHMSFEFGRLLQRVGFDPDLYSAGVWLIGAVSGWRKLMGLPPLHAKPVMLEMTPDQVETGEVGGAGFDPRSDQERLESAAKRHRMAYDWLGEAGQDVRAETIRVVLREEPPADPALVLRGLRAVSARLRG